MCYYYCFFFLFFSHSSSMSSQKASVGLDKYRNQFTIKQVYCIEITSAIKIIHFFLWFYLFIHLHQVRSFFYANLHCVNEKKAIEKYESNWSDKYVT